jgi:Tol biopolymer transport system component
VIPSLPWPRRGETPLPQRFFTGGRIARSSWHLDLGCHGSDAGAVRLRFLVLACVVVACSSAVGISAPLATACAMLIRPTGAAEPAWSPDGRRVALTWRQSGDSVDVWNTETHKLTLLAAGSHPAWSPDGRRLAYQADLPLPSPPPLYACGPWTQSDLFLTTLGPPSTSSSSTPLLAGSPINLTQTTTRWERSPTWSPDARRLAFSFVDGAGSSGLGLLELATRKETVLTSAGFDPVWSPRGGKLAYRLDNNEIAVAKADGVLIRTLTPPTGLYLDAFSWSPDGRKLAFSAGGRDYQGGLFVINANGTGLRRLTRGLDSDPVWSPDGRQLLFVGAGSRGSHPALPSRAGFTRLYLIATNGHGRARRLF